jgi:hypothetical protein
MWSKALLAYQPSGDCPDSSSQTAYSCPATVVKDGCHDSTEIDVEILRYALNGRQSVTPGL